jgi:hypothetical protein
VRRRGLGAGRRVSPVLVQESGGLAAVPQAAV